MNTSAITRLWRRTLMAIGAGRITQVDDSRSAQVMQVQLGQDELKDDTPRLAEYGFVSNPPVGSDAVVLFIAGERTNGVVVATNNQTVRMTGLASGEVAIHDDKGRFVYLSAAGIHVQGKDSPIVVETTSDITATAGGNITLQAGALIKLQAPSVEIDTTTMTVNATTITTTATTVTTEAATLGITAATTLTGITSLIGDTSVTGAMTNNGHDVGSTHEHAPGTFRAGGTAVTGISGAVTP
jgi:phage baseplate assembly protein V